jgi:hypothetical protein
MGKQDMYSWRAAMLEHKLEKLGGKFYFDRLEDAARLASSGLPRWETIKVPYEEFTEGNITLQKFLSNHNRFLLGVIPKKGTEGLTRGFSKDIWSWEDCLEFLKDPERNKTEFHKFPKQYNLKVAEYEPATHGGVIVSNPKGIRAETIREHHYTQRKTRLRGLSGLCEGETPDLSCRMDLTRTGHITDKTSWEENAPVKEIARQRRIILQALHYLELTRDSFNPHFMRGYFEFVCTDQKGETIIKFWDYKDPKISPGLCT